MQISRQLINLLSIFLKCNGFTGIQKAVVDQMVSRPPNSDMIFFLVQVWLWEVLWSCFLIQPLRWLLAAVVQNHFSSQVIIQLRNGLLLLSRRREDNTSKGQFLKFLVNRWGTHLSRFFTFPICFKFWMTVEWLTLSSSTTSCVVVKESALMILSIGLVNFQWPATAPLIFKALVSFAKLRVPPLHYTFISSFWAKCNDDDVSCLHCVTTRCERE